MNLESLTFTAFLPIWLGICQGAFGKFGVYVFTPAMDLQRMQLSSDLRLQEVQTLISPEKDSRVLSNEWMLNLAKQKEIQRTKEGDYPSNWPEIADFVKTINQWKCERCGKAHERDGVDGFVLTVHHLDGIKTNCELWNLAALCQRCHLRIQNKVVWFRIPKKYNWLSYEWFPITEYPYWMARHVKQFNNWVKFEGGCKEEIPITHVYEKDYSEEWKS